ncbi:MAG TPA: cyclic dehypoxanthinyl futalosine synthase [Elusimicrobiota bacterium]|nr:cyclic dehypoxanthinyl futalosine synthase [Elusimicrobiota bacterium]
MNISAITKNILQGRRLTRSEGLRLLDPSVSLTELGALAQSVRFKKNPAKRVTFIVDTNPNYTNICEHRCAFCAFYRRKGQKDAYVLTPDQVMTRVRWAVRRGAKTILLQGGCNPEIPFAYYTELVRRVKKAYPTVTPHFFSAPEIIMMSRSSGQSIQSVLAELWAAGMRTLPGGGAEILSDRVRKKVSPLKGTPKEWLEVHRIAHRMGYRSTATMMFGHIEKDEDIIDHLDRIRSLQDETGGFTAFIPWSFKPQGTALQSRIRGSASPVRYLRILALSRVYLDNFPHIQGSWFSEGKEAGMMALYFGADDMGGTVLEENVHAASGVKNRATAEDVKDLIRSAGFTPIERTTDYKVC